MDRKWIVKRLKNVKLNKPIMIEGLPGIGNVGKISIDFIIESLKAQKIYEIYSDSFPNFVLVNEKGVIELPKVEVYHKKIKGQDFFLVSGDVQPVDEKSSYDFCERLLELFEKTSGREIVTLGGMGLEDIPKIPKVYCSGTDRKLIEKFKASGIKSAEGIVGPIVGVSGLLVGLCKTRGMSGTVLLVETLAVPHYLGIKESRELLKILNEHYKLGLNMNNLNKEISIIEKDIREKLEKFVAVEKKRGKQEISYIG